MPGIKPQCRSRHLTARCIRRHGGAAQCPHGAPRVLLLHGLEGSSYAVYVQGLARQFARAG